MGFVIMSRMIVRLVVVPMIVVRLLGWNRRMVVLCNPRVVGVGLVLMRDFGCRLLDRFAGRLIARIGVSRGLLAHDVFASRDLGGPGRRFAGGEGGARNGLVAAGMRTLAMAVAAAIAAVVAARLIVGFVVIARGARIGVDQRLPVGDGDLVIIRMDFGKRQEAVAVAAIFDERRLQRRFDARNLG